MKAMILAAGRGERMLPLTKTTPKPLLKVAGTTLIERHLKRLATAGCDAIVINIYYLGSQIQEHLGSEQYGMPIVYSEEAELLETAGGINAALPLLGEDPFLVVNGDIFTDFDFAALLRRQTSVQPHLVMVPNPPHHSEGDYAVDAGGVLRSNGDQFYTYSGIGVYSAAFFAQMQPGKLMLRPLFDAAVSTGKLTGELFSGMWTDVGTPERYALLTEQYP